MNKHRVARSDVGDSIVGVQGMGDLPGERVWAPANRLHRGTGVMDTPWGRADTAVDIGMGIMRVSTPSHGGFAVPPSVLRIMPGLLVNRDGWYEEDCEWSKVAVAFPHLFSRDDFAKAERILINQFPDAASSIGCDVTLDNSSALRERAFRNAHKDDYVAVAAWGDWPGLPKESVLVLAVRGGRNERGGYASHDQRYFLVNDAEYAKRSSFGFVVDEKRHRQVESPSLESPALAISRVPTAGTLRL